MRNLAVAVLAAVAATAMQPAPSQAQGIFDGQWCLSILIDDYTTTDQCNFRSFEACRDVLRGQSSARCVPNPYWQEAREPRRSRSQRAR